MFGFYDEELLEVKNGKVLDLEMWEVQLTYKNGKFLVVGEGTVYDELDYEGAEQLLVDYYKDLGYSLTTNLYVPNEEQVYDVVGNL